MSRFHALRPIELGANMAGMASVNAIDDAAGSLERVLAAWNDLSPSDRYFFQTLPWVELLAMRVTSGVVWHVTLRHGRAIFVSILRRRLFSLGGIRLRILTSLRPVPQMPPFADSLTDLGAATHLYFGDIANDLEPWHALRLRGLRAGSPWLKVSADNLKIASEPQEGVGIFDTSSSIEERWRTVPKNMRNTIRKARNRIGKRGRIVVATGDAIAAAFDEFVALESAGWKGHAGTSLAQTPGERELLREYFVTSDTAEVRSLHIEGRLAASQLSLKVVGTQFLLKVAYDESVADLSPSHVLFADLIESCCKDSSVNRIDCIAWQPWHAQWGMTREPTYELIAFNRSSAGGWLAMIGWSLRPRAKHLKAVKSVMKRAGAASVRNKILAVWRSTRNGSAKLSGDKKQY
jgi:CelD/BcsL family acetyltransferase involved in cellulose biosynthesis